MTDQNRSRTSTLFLLLLTAACDGAQVQGAPAPGASESEAAQAPQSSDSGNSTLAPAFYVSPTGSDSNTGTLALPFKTLNKCQTAMHGSTTKKTCYIRGGTYTVSMLQFIKLGSGAAMANTALKLTSADNGTTWSYYPPDGLNTAVLDGGNKTTGVNSYCQNTAYLDIGFYIGGANDITVNGLTFQHFSFGGILVHGGQDIHGSWVPTGPDGEGSSDGVTIENNIVQDINNGPNPIGNDNYGSNNGCPTTGTYTGYPNGENTDNQEGGMVYAHGPISNLTIANNVGLNMMATCIQLETQNGNDNLNGLTVTNNYCGNTGTAANDVGALHVRLYAGVNTPTTATGAVISNNYFHDCGGVTAGSTAEPGSSKCIYMDDLTSGITLTGNVMAGHFTYGAFIAHGAHDNTWTGNIVDLGDGADGSQHIGIYQSSTACTTGSSCMVKNEWHHNIVIADNSIDSDGGYELLNQGNYTAPTLQNDLDYEYGSGSINDSASVSSANPQLSTSGWAYVLATGGPAYDSPVSFPKQPSNWGQAGFWGPPGYVIPQTGTKPSYLR